MKSERTERTARTARTALLYTHLNKAFSVSPLRIPLQYQTRLRWGPWYLAIKNKTDKEQR
jgi:hypothetical protein